MQTTEVMACIEDILAENRVLKEKLLEAQKQSNHWFDQALERTGTIAQLSTEKWEIASALGEILGTVALDWYVQQFAYNGQDHMKSGVAAKIHDAETLDRIKAAFERGRRALRASTGSARASLTRSISGV